MLRRLACRLGFHAWDHRQELLLTDGWGDGRRNGIVFAWKQCPKCGASRFIHALQ